MGLNVGLGASPGGSKKKTIFDLDYFDVAVNIKQTDNFQTRIFRTITIQILYHFFTRCIGKRVAFGALLLN